MLPSLAIWNGQLLAVVVLAALALHFVVTARRRLLIGAETLFLGMATCTYFATWARASGTGSAQGMRYAFFIGVGIVCFVLGTVAATTVARFDHRRELDAFVDRPWRDDLCGVKRTFAVLVGFVAVGVTIAYFVQVGVFVPVDALRALVESGPAAMMETYAALRASTRVGDYLGLGYVMQFKDVLLPLVALLFLVQYRIGSAERSARWLALFLSVALVGAVGTGARFPLAMLGALVALIGIAPFMAPASLSLRQSMAFGGGILAFLSALTMMMGRRGQLAPVEGLLWAPYQVLERVCIGPAGERLLVFERFLFDKEPQLGAAAVDSLRIALPGASEYTLPNQLHELLYGNPSGNVGLDVWGALWYDWQWGGLLLAFGLGFVFHAMYVKILRGPKRVIRVVALTHAGFILGLATDLQVLLLRGFLSVLLFLVISEVLGSIGVRSTLVGAAAGGRS